METAPALDLVLASKDLEGIGVTHDIDATHVSTDFTTN